MSESGVRGGARHLIHHVQVRYCGREAGQSVLLWLKAELLRADYQVTEPDAEDWGWYMDVQDADAAYLVGASADAEAPLEWTVQVHKHRSMTDRLLGRNKMAADDRLSALIERLIRADGAMQQISVAREA